MLWSRRELFQVAAAKILPGLAPPITRVEVFPAPYPVTGHFKFFRTAERPTVLVKITCESGLAGWGQSVPTPTWSYETVESVASTLERYLAPVLVGLPADDEAAVRRAMEGEIAPSVHTGQPIAKSAVDMALCDLLSRSAGQSLAACLRSWMGASPEGFSTRVPLSCLVTSSDPEVWRAAGVSHLLSVGPWPRPGLVELRRFGGLVLYRFADFSPAPAWLEGPGRLRILEQRPELLRLQIEGTQPDSRLYVRRARYGLWRASSDGRPVEITGASVGDSPAVFMSLAARDGELVIEFTAGAGEWLGGLASLLGLLAALLLLVNGLRPSWLGGLPSRLAPLARPLRAGTTLATLALVLLLSIYLIVRLSLPAPPDFSGRRVVADLSRQLAGASAEVVRPGGKSPCQPFDGRRIKCPGPEWNYAGRTIIGADHLLRQCVWLHPIQGAEFVLHFDGVELGDRLEGFFGMDDAVVEPPSSHDVQFTVYLDGQRLEQLDCPSRRGWFHWRVDTPGRRGSRGRVSVSSAARFTGRRHFCFTAYTTAGGT